MKKLGRRDLPLSRDASARFLPWLIAFMVYLAALALVGAEALQQTAERWSGALSGRVTVQLVPETAGVAESEVDAALAILGAVPAVRELEVLDREESAALLEPWLGEAARDPDLPLPVLITVTLSGDVAAAVAEIRARLASALPEAQVDDHRGWIGGLLDLTRGLQLLALFLLLLVGAAAVTTVVFVTRTGLAVHRPVIELLHLMGARDAQVAARFQAHAFSLGLQGGLLGLLAAILSYLALDQGMDASTMALLPSLSLGPRLLILLALLPLATALVALATARLTVLRTLARMP